MVTFSADFDSNHLFELYRMLSAIVYRILDFISHHFYYSSWIFLTELNKYVLIAIPFFCHKYKRVPRGTLLRIFKFDFLLLQFVLNSETHYCIQIPVVFIAVWFAICEDEYW